METNGIITDGAVEVTESSTPENDTVQTALSPSDELVKSLMANDDFVTLIKTAVAGAVSTPDAEQTSETETSVEDSTEISKSVEEVATPDVMELVKSAVTDATAALSAQIAALSERIPEVGLPGVLIKSEQETDAEIIAELRSDPRQALRVSLAAAHGELDKLR